jgi:2-methylaconitate cis-trans-isomerase PrpF
MPAAVDADHDLGARLEKLRVEAAARMGMAESAAVPKIAFVAPPTDTIALDGVRYPPAAGDLVGRAISMGSCHRAFPLTVAMCLAVAARIEGTLVHECVSGATRREPASPQPAERREAGAHVAAARPTDVRLVHPSGVLPLDAAVGVRDGQPWAERVTVYRSARRLMEGFVRVP